MHTTSTILLAFSLITIEIARWLNVKTVVTNACVMFDHF